MPTINPRRTLAFAILIGIVVASIGCAQQRGLRSTPRTATLGGDSVTLPVTWVCDMMLVDVMVNGAGPFAMILDTGAAATIVTPSVAAAVRDDVVPANITLQGSDGATMRLRTAVDVRSLSAGDWEVGGFTAPIVDLRGVSDALGVEIDGVLGMPLFERQLLIMDYPGREVRVRKGSLVGTEHPTQYRAGNAKRPHAPIVIDGEPRIFLVDTGAFWGMHVADALLAELETEAPPVVSKGGVGVSGRLNTSRYARLSDTATLGEHRLVQPIVHGGSYNLLGSTVLRHFVLTYDHTSRTIRFDREADEPIVFDSRRAHGVTFRRPVGEPWTVWGVDDATLPVRVGDTVLAINGTPVGEYDCGTFSSIDDVNDTLALDILRDGERLVVEVPVSISVR